MPRLESKQRARILDAAVGMFAEHGLKGATIRRVGAAAGVNSALMYYYFEDKQTLFTEAIRMVLRGFLDHLQRRKTQFSGARERLDFLVSGVFDYYTAHADRMRLMTVALTLHSDVLGRTLAGFVRNRALVPLDVIRDGIAKGDLRPAPPIQVWWSILSLCLFSLRLPSIVAHMDPELMPGSGPDIMSTRKKEIVDLLLSGLAMPDKRRRTGRKG